MPSDPAQAVRRVCIVIFTYQRNAELLRVAGQCREIIQNYRGHNHYELCVSDSDPANPMAPLPAELNARYLTNPGKGFDDNIYHFWLGNMDQYDFIFSLSDDDLFAPWMNPLYVLDAAMDTGHQMALFNNRNYKWNPDGGIELGIANFPEIELVCNKATLLHRVLTIVPCHVGLLYSTALLKRTVEKAKAFRGTLHLYVVPILFAAASNTLLFSDYVLCLYHNDTKLDGAWAVSEGVMNGLLEFLKNLKQLLSAEMYSIAETSFFAHYFSAGAPLREQLRHSPTLRSEEEIRGMLAAL